MAPPALCLARRRASCDTKTKPQPRRAIRARLFDLCSQRKPVTHASRSQHVRSPPVVSCMPCALCAVPCGQKRLFLKNLGRGLAGCIAFQHALCMCRECQSACLAPFLRACPIAESGLPQCVHKRVGFLGGGHCDCIAAVLHFCSVEENTHMPYTPPGVLETWASTSWSIEETASWGSVLSPPPNYLMVY